MTFGDILAFRLAMREERGQLSVSQAADGSAHADGGRVPNRKRIMLVEDTASHRKLYASWLRIGGYDPHVVADERSVHQMAEDVRPAAIIVDIRLPNVSGLDVIEGLKTDERTRAIPVMALTVLDSETDRHACLAAGADVFVTKPDRIATFLDRIADLVA